MKLLGYIFIALAIASFIAISIGNPHHMLTFAISTLVGVVILRDEYKKEKNK